MRVVHVNYDGAKTGGASIAMLRIHHAMLSVGVDSIVICATLSKDEKAISVPMAWWCKALQFCVKCVMKLVFGMIFPTGLVPTGRVKHINGLRPDAVVLHWLQGDALSMREISRIEAPVFYMHHDMWPSLGLQAYPNLAMNCRFKWIVKKLDALVQRNKMNAYREASGRLYPAATNRWVEKIIHQQAFFGDTKCVVIPCPLSAVFMEAKSKLSERNRPRNEKFVILNGSNFGFCDGVKGADRLAGAIALIPQEERSDMIVKIFGGMDGPSVLHGVPVEYLGRFDERGLVPIYFSADLFAFPSRQETFGQTKIEALACGTPVVAFDETACAEGVLHKENGWIAAADDIAEFAEGIRYFYAAWKRGEAVRVVGDKAYSAEAVAQEWIRAIVQAVRQQEGLET